MPPKYTHVFAPPSCGNRLSRERAGEWCCGGTDSGHDKLLLPSRGKDGFHRIDVRVLDPPNSGKESAVTSRS